MLKYFYFLMDIMSYDNFCDFESVEKVYNILTKTVEETGAGLKRDPASISDVKVAQIACRGGGISKELYTIEITFFNDGKKIKDVIEKLGISYEESDSNLDRFNISPEEIVMGYGVNAPICTNGYALLTYNKKRSIKFVQNLINELKKKKNSS